MRREASRARDPLELTIESLGAGGDGVARVGDAAIYVPWTLPGERVRAVPAGARRARPIAWLETSAERAPPRCPHFTACGGCALQHLGEETYARWKLERAREALARSGFENAPLAPLVRAAPLTRRRANFAVRRLAKGVVLGFHAPLSREIVDLEECPVLVPTLARLAPGLRRLALALLRPGGSGDVVATATETGVDLLLVGFPPPDRAAREMIAAFAEASDVARIAHAASATASAELLIRRRGPLVTLGGVGVEPPPGAFLQATLAGEAAIVAATRDAVGGALRVADLYAGIGTLTLPLLAAGARLRAVDASAAALDALDAAARRAGAAPRLAIERRDLDRRPLVGEELAGLDAIVFDPPRDGARAQAEALAVAGPPVVVAVSCNPATFARDAAILRAGGYALDRLTPIDQFLWSPHLELVGGFTRGR